MTLKSYFSSNNVELSDGSVEAYDYYPITVLIGVFNIKKFYKQFKLAQIWKIEKTPGTRKMI